MTVHAPALLLILLFPALGVLFNVLAGARAGRAAVNLVGAGVVFAAFAAAAWCFMRLAAMPAGGALEFQLWPWIEAGRFHVGLGLRLDALSGVMVMVVSGVGSLIHLYSTGYMAEDEDYARFFAYMNLFTLSMLVLVAADNLLMMFVGWEGVGLCSYLLIGFWYSNAQFAYNGRKAFVVNRVGDAGFLLGLFLLVAGFSARGVWTLDFAAMRAQVGLLSPALASAAGLLLFAGATGKSAQIPLYVWLPDAMVGPTPVSALIHAATMVTAGVYMVARLGFLYRLGPQALEVVAAIGAYTALFAATIALVQPDIKRVLAYSTISQLGYMFVGVGVSAFASGIFHLMTHAFFKALLFLCAGSVIHALGGEQDMNRMGGLRSRMPITYATMLVATLAISAVPPFSGYFSKDLILQAAYASGHTWLWLMGVITAALTSLYMFRLLLMTFHGASRVEPSRLPHVHEAPASMAIPLVVLAMAAAVGGWIGLPDGVLWGNAFARFLAPVVGTFKPTVEASELMLSVAASGAAFAGIAIAYYCYILRPELPARLAARAQGAYRLLLEKYYIDQLYDLVISRPLFVLAGWGLNRVVDSYAIDGLADGAGLTVETAGGLVRKAETGNVQHYALVYLLGAILIAAYYLYLVLH